MKHRPTCVAACAAFIVLLSAPVVRANTDAFDPPVPPPGVLKLSRVMLSHLEAGRVDAAADALGNLVTQRHESGISNLSPVAAAFAAVFERGATDASPRQRRELAESAIELAPDYPRLYFVLARARLAEGLNGIGPAAAAFMDGVSRIPTFPRSATMYAANAAFYLQGLFLILYIIGAFALLFRYFSLFRHDFGDIFPGIASTYFTALDIREARGGIRALFSVTSATVLSLIVIIILVAPVVLGFGLLATAALWMFLSFPYAGRSERVVAIIATLVIACVPIAGSVVALPDRLEGTPGTMRWSCINEYCPADWLTAIKGSLISAPANDAPEGSSLDSWMAAASGERQWIDDSPESIAALRTSLESSVEVMGSAPGRVHHGNALVLQALATCPEKNPDRELLGGAVKSYETALSLGAGGQAAFRGLAIAHGLLHDPAKSDEYIQKLVESRQVRDLDFMVRIKTATSASDACQRYHEIAGELRPPAAGRGMTTFLGGQSLISAVMATPPRIPFKTLLFGSIPPLVMPVVLGALAMFGILLVFLIPASRRAFRCGTCGHVTCPSCSRLASGFNHCPICLFDKVKPSYLDPEDVQIMLKPRSVRGLRRALTILFSIVIPGSGQLVSGKAFRGMAMLMMLGLGLEMVIFPEFPVVDYFAYAPPAASGLPVLPPILLVVAWTWSVIDVIVTRGK